jgi:Fic family protein
MTEPYLPPLLPLDCIRWEDHITLIGKANRALARYDGMLSGMVEPEVLLSPMGHQEAVLSSRIEGTQVSLEEVLEYQADPTAADPSSKKNKDIKEIVNYRAAMYRAENDLKRRPLCLNLVKELHSILLEDVRGQNMMRGQFRRSQNYIAPVGSPIEKAIYVPPPCDKVESYMDNWERYIHTEEKDPLVQLAVVKAQFELIHPFNDGNGRLGRMWVPLFLYASKLLTHPVFYISDYLEKNKDVYYERLGAISREGDWNNWISFFLTAIIEQAEININKSKKIYELYETFKKDLPQITKSRFGVRALDTIFSIPIFRSSLFVQLSGIPNRASASRVLKDLKDSGIIKELRAGRGRSSALLIFPELLRITENDS